MPRFQRISRSSIYMDVATQIWAAILEGTMSSRERLPPERELARQFEVSRASPLELALARAAATQLRQHLGFDAT